MAVDGVEWAMAAGGCMEQCREVGCRAIGLGDPTTPTLALQSSRGGRFGNNLRRLAFRRRVSGDVFELLLMHPHTPVVADTTSASS